MVLILCFINDPNPIVGFAHADPPLQTRNQAHFIMANYPIKVLVDPVCQDLGDILHPYPSRILVCNSPFRLDLCLLLRSRQCYPLKMSLEVSFNFYFFGKFSGQVLILFQYFLHSQGQPSVPGLLIVRRLLNMFDFHSLVQSLYRFSIHSCFRLGCFYIYLKASIFSLIVEFVGMLLLIMFSLFNSLFFLYSIFI